MATPLTTIRQFVRARLLETLALTTPGSPLVSVQGTPGAVTVAYAIVAKNNSGASEASQSTTVTTANATLSVTNFNRLTWQAVPGETDGYDIYRTTANGAPATTGLIASVATGITTYDDVGAAGDSAAAPTANTSGIDSPFWTQQELFDILALGCKDLWKSIVDLHQGHFTTIDEANVSLVSGSTTLAGVPTDCFRILMIEPRDITESSGGAFIYFKPKQYHSLDFQRARSLSGTGIGTGMGNTVYYDILNAGSPVGAPSIVIAPVLQTTLLLRVVYVHILPTLTESSDNPVPGESDNALVAWCMAWARAKEREDRMPDPAWLAVYNTEKQGLLTALTPRQEQEEEVVEGLFDGFC